MATRSLFRTQAACLTTPFEQSVESVNVAIAGEN